MGMSRFLATAAVTLLCLVGSSSGQASDANDPGIRDTLTLEITYVPTADPLSDKFRVELWVFSDSVIKVVTGGFTWDNPKLQMDSAVVSELARENLDGGTFVYKNADLATTNSDRQFMFGGFRIMRPGLPGDASARRLWATYYFTATNWQPGDHFEIDTSQWDTGSQHMYVSQHNLGYWPETNLPVRFGQPDTSGMLVEVSPDTVRQHNGPIPHLFTIIGAGTDFTSTTEPIVEFVHPETTLVISDTADVLVRHDDTLVVQQLMTTNLPSGLWSIRVTVDGKLYNGTHLLTVLPPLFAQDPNDPGDPDYVFFRWASPPYVADQPQPLQLQLYDYNDFPVSGANCVFQWENDYLTLDSAVGSPLVVDGFDVVLGLYVQTLEESNQFQRFRFGGAGLNDAIPGDSLPHLLATYYFTLDQWQPHDVLLIDTLSWLFVHYPRFMAMNVPDYRIGAEVPYIYHSYDTLHPRIVNVVPDQVLAGDTLRTTIVAEDTRFIPDSTDVRLVNGSDTLVGFELDVRDHTHLGAAFAIPFNAEGTTWDVEVTMPRLGTVIGEQLVFVLIEDSTGTVRRVPQDYPTIQSAIDAAREHDTVLVAPGRYYENLIFRGVDIVLASEFILQSDSSLIDSTIIDGSHKTRDDSAGCVISLENGETYESQIIGFSIENGTGLEYPFTAQWTDFRGGGIHVANSGLTLLHCSIRNNRMSGTHNRGGGIYVSDGTGSHRFNLHHCTIGNNAVSATNSRHGAGLFALGVEVSIRDNRFADNDGIAMALFDNTSGLVGGNEIVDNDSTGIYTQTDITLNGNVILRNGSDGIFANYSELDLSRNVIADNDGYGIVSRASFVNSQNNTVVSNTQGGLYKFWSNGTQISLYNDIFWYNGDGSVGSQVRLEEAVTFHSAYSDIQGGFDGIYKGTGVQVMWEPGNIDLPPMFVDMLNHNYALAPGSPCIDAGDPALQDPDSSRIDMGAIPFRGGFAGFTLSPDAFDMTLASGETAQRSLNITNLLDTTLLVTLGVLPIFGPDSIGSNGGQYDGLGADLYSGAVAWPSVLSDEPAQQRRPLPFNQATVAKGAVLFQDDMESGQGGWTVLPGLGSADWMLQFGVGLGNSHGWHAEQAPTAADVRLISPTIDLQTADGAVLSFQHMYEFDDCDRVDFEADGGIVEVSTDNGATWQQIYPTGGYPYTLDDICANPLAHRRAYSHSTANEFVPAMFDLRDWVGSEVRISFRAGWDCGNCRQNLGWVVDNVVVREGAVNDWLTVSPDTLVIPGGSSRQATVWFDATALFPGVFRAEITVNDDFDNIPDGIVPVALTVTGGEQVHPTNEWISLWCGEAYLSGNRLVAGTEIRAYDPDGVLCGIDTVRAGGAYGFMLVYRDDPFTDFDEGAEPGDEISFTIGGVRAMHHTPVVWTGNGDRSEACYFDATICHQFVLSTGWNLISWPMAHRESIESFITDFADCIDVVMSFDRTGLMYDPLLPEFSTLDSVDYYHGYWIRATCPITFQLCGTEINPRSVIPLRSDWNLVPYWPTSQLTPTLALPSLGLDVEVVLGFDGGATIWQPSGNFNTLEFMAPGFGYWIRMKQPRDLIYPGFGPPILSPGVSDDVVTTPASSQWMSLYGENIRIDDQPLADNSTVSVYTAGGDLCGRAVYRNNSLKFMPVYGRDQSGHSAKLAGEGDDLVLTVNGQPIETKLAWSGHGARIELTSLKSSGRPGLPTSFSLSQNYPNPFNPTTTIEFGLARASDVHLEVYNIMGQRVATVIEQSMAAGYHTVVWDGTDHAGQTVATGIYFYRLSAGDFVKTRKMLLMK